MSARQARRIALAALLAVPALQRQAEAKSTFVVNNLDAAGSGFNDPTPAAPVGGNPGTTVGAQRLAAFREAANIWAAALDSRVPVVIDAQFGPLSCSGGRITLGQAAATGLETGRPGLPANMYFPEPLADRIAEVDLNPGEADIAATFNGQLLACSGGLQDWYYGFDGKPSGNNIDLISVVLHELGHGLGFSSGVDDNTGALAGGLIDSFSAHVFDNGTGRAWMAMSNAERAASARNFRHLVWNGADVAKTAPLVLAKGAPRLRVTPMPGSLSAAIAEANFGPFLAAGSVTGMLKIGTPLDGCSFSLPDYAGAIVVYAGGVCPSAQKASLAETAGAAAVLIADPEGISPPSSVDVPPDQEATYPVHVPVIGITVADAMLLQSAGSSNTVMLDADAARPVGVDEEGRMYLYASDPILPGSTVSHWDPLARPDLMQEPNATYDMTHDIRLEVALMHDIGWTPFCGNGRIDPDEECDTGASNSDTTPGACRSTCVNPRCGDAVTDPAEACDTGANNSDTTADACRTNCMKAACGDGVVDLGEQCDDGAKNAAGAACTPACKIPPPADKGCGCGLGGAAPVSAPVAGLLAALLLARGRRRRRR